MFTSAELAALRALKNALLAKRIFASVTASAAILAVETPRSLMRAWLELISKVELSGNHASAPDDTEIAFALALARRISNPTLTKPVEAVVASKYLASHTVPPKRYSLSLSSSTEIYIPSEGSVNTHAEP